MGRSYIQGKLDELPSFRSNDKANNELTLQQIQQIVNDPNLQYQPISFLNSLTSQQNVFGNFDQIEPINEYKQTFKAFEESVLQKRYRIKFENELIVYKIITQMNDIYQCQRVYISNNKNDGFPLTIYLTLHQLIHTKEYIKKQVKNTNIFRLNDLFYFKCNDDANCLCQCIEDESKQFLFYEVENEIDCIVGMTFETKKILYKIVDIDANKNVLCKLVSQQNRFYGQQQPKDDKAEIIISFNMEQIKHFKWMKKKKKKKNNQ